MASDPLEGKGDPTVPAGPHGAERIALAADDTIRQESTRPVPADASPGPRIRISRPKQSFTRLGRYAITQLLGSGGMGSVFEAHDGELDRRVAIKVLREDRDADALTEALRREAQALAKLVHPNVVAVYDVGFDQGQLFVVMQMIDGESIDHWLRAREANPAKIVAAFRDAGRGLAAAHAANLVHCDFKPANVLVDRDGVVRVGDFGLAQFGAETRESVAGTPRYMAPEQFGGVATAASDQYSFCVALWEVLAGEPPFPDTPLDDGEAARTRTLPELPRSARVPGYVVRALMRGLSRDPAERFPSMEALLAALAPPAWRRWAVGGAAGGLVLGGAIVATFALSAPAAGVHAPPAAAVVAPPDAGVALPAFAAPRAVTHYGTEAAACAPAIDGDHVVFHLNKGNAMDLYTVALAGGTPRQLTSSPSLEWRANPGRHRGEVIHLLQDPADSTAAEIAYLDTATGKETVAATQLTPDAGVIDGGIVYISRDEQDLRKIVGGQDVVLAHAPAGYAFNMLAVSHHRDRVAAVALKDHSKQLCIVDVKTGASHCTATKELTFRPAFGADDRVLYLCALDGIHRRVLATDDDTVLVPDVEAVGGLAVSDDGGALVYSNCNARAQIVDWTTQQVLVDEDASEPDGTSAQHLVWVRYEHGHAVLVAGGDGPATQLTDPQFGSISEVAMSPDGDVVAFRSGPPHVGIYTMPVHSGAAVQRISDDEHDHAPVWVGDDQLVFTRYDDHQVPTVFTAASDGAMPRPLPGPGRTAIAGREHRLLVATHWKLYWLDLATGRERPGPPLDPSVTNNSTMVASPDGRWLLVLSGTEQQLIGRLRLDPPGPFEPLAQLPAGETVDGGSITNDGHVLLAPNKWTGDLYLIPAQPGSRF